MSNYLSLTKILLKNGLVSTSRKTAFKKKSALGQTALYALVAVSMLPMLFMFFSMAGALYDMLAGVGQQGLVLVMGFWATAMVVFVFGFFYVINVFYFANDIENLLPLPLRPSEILAAKFTVALIYEYLTEILFLLPILVAYGLKAGVTIQFVLYALAIFLTLPIIPLIYSAIINMVIMRFTNLGKRKDLLRTAGGILGVLMGVGINVVIQRFTAKGMNPQMIQEMLQSGNNSLVSISSSIFPSNKFAALTLVNATNLQGMINMVFYLLFTIVFVVLFLAVGEALYFKGVLGVSEVSGSRRKLSQKEFERTVVQSSIIKAFVLKELRLLIRTPIYFMNCIMMNFLWPIFFLIPVMARDGRSGLGDILTGINDPQYAGIIVAAAFGISMFISGSNLITSTSISREGQNIYFSKFIPVSYKDQILAKVLSAVVVGLLGATGLLIVIGIIAGIKLHIILMSIVASIMAVLFTSFFGILIDLKWPKLDWDNEQKAVKQNMNGVISILFCMLLGAVNVIPLIVLKLNAFLVLILIAAIYGLVNLLLYLAVMNFGVKAFNNIEV